MHIVYVSPTQVSYVWKGVNDEDEASVNLCVGNDVHVGQIVAGSRNVKSLEWWGIKPLRAACLYGVHLYQRAIQAN